MCISPGPESCVVSCEVADIGDREFAVDQAPVTGGLVSYTDEEHHDSGREAEMKPQAEQDRAEAVSHLDAGTKRVLADQRPSSEAQLATEMEEPGLQAKKIKLQPKMAHSEDSDDDFAAQLLEGELCCVDMTTPH